MTHIDVESASENANAVTPENRWMISGWSDQKSTKITSHSKPPEVAAQAELSEPPRAHVEALHRARERQRGDHQQEHAEHADPGIGRLRDGAVQRVGGVRVELEARREGVGEVVAALRRDRADHDQQRQQGRERLAGERHRAVEALQLDEPPEAAADELHGRQQLVRHRRDHARDWQAVGR